MRHLRYWREAPLWCRDWLYACCDRFVSWWLARNARKVNEGHDRWT